MYQGGRHPAIQAGTRLSFLTNGDFDEITNTSGNNILWYIPEKYLEAYLEDTRDMEKDEMLVEEELSPLLQSIIGCKSPSEYEAKKAEASQAWESRVEVIEIDKGDKGMDR